MTIMATDHVRALLIEDSPDDALLMREELADAGTIFVELEWVDRLSTGLERLEGEGFDVVLLDLSLPDSSGVETLRGVRDQAPDVPIVVLTGLDDDALARELVKEGAQDYLTKAEVDGALLVRSMLYAIERNRLLAELQEAKNFAEARLTAVVENTPVIMFSLDRDGVFTLCEGRGLESLGTEPGDLVGRSIFDVYRYMPKILENVRAALAGHRRSIVVEVARGVTLEVSYEPVRDQNDVTGVVGVAHDISLRKRLEEQFLQSQNMEAVGQLAGGIAHDFNNILSAILGYAQLGLTSLPSGSHLDGYLTEIQKSAERAAILTRQLLTFSRRQIIQPEVFDPSELILNMHSMLRRLIGEDIDLVVRPDPDAGRVEMDKGQMEQVLVNLAINARDAMPNGGRLLIETANVTLENQYVELNGETTLENYVMLLVSDSGMGMTEEVKAHIFEPFFTTKGPGKGTGLGYRLATASWPRAEVASPLTASGGGGPR